MQAPPQASNALYMKKRDDMTGGLPYTEAPSSLLGGEGADGAGPGGAHATGVVPVTLESLVVGEEIRFQQLLGSRGFYQLTVGLRPYWRPVRTYMWVLLALAVLAVSVVAVLLLRPPPLIS